MKKIAKILTAYLLSLAIVLQLPVRSFAETPGARYISEIRLGVGKKAAEKQPDDQRVFQAEFCHVQPLADRHRERVHRKTHRYEKKLENAHCLYLP